MTGTIAPGTPYYVSLVSPWYLNTAPNGTVNIGFSYSAPAGTLYRIKVIRQNSLNSADILAQTSQGPAVFGTTANWAALPAGSGDICLLLQDADLIMGQTLRYEFTFYVPTLTSAVVFDNFALNSTAPSPLPVQFMGVVATQTETGVVVRWDVAEEIDVKEYQLEKSTDGSSFTTVRTVSAEGKTVYGTTDLSPKAALVYYRVKSVDLDGSVKYSGIVRLVNGTTSGKLKAYPSPASSQVTIQHKQLEASAKISVLTSDGRVVKALTPAKGLSNTMIEIGSLPAGLYHVRLDYGNGKMETTSFLKQ